MDDVEWCRFIAEIEAGTLEPYFVDIPDGHYTRRVVQEEIKICSFGSVDEIVVPVETVEWRYEPCDIPRFRRELRYRRTQEVRWTS